MRSDTIATKSAIVEIYLRSELERTGIQISRSRITKSFRRFPRSLPSKGSNFNGSLDRCDKNCKTSTTGEVG